MTYLNKTYTARSKAIIPTTVTVLCVLIFSIRTLRNTTETYNLFFLLALCPVDSGEMEGEQDRLGWAALFDCGTSSAFHITILDRGIANCRLSRVVIEKTSFLHMRKQRRRSAGNREANRRLCFRNKDSTIPLLPKSESSSL